MASHPIVRRRRILAAAVAALMAATAATAAEPVRLEFPSQSPGIPAYARLVLIAGIEVPMTERWTAIAFYRDPDCVPPDFNLGQFFHVPGPDGPGAFGCELLIEGHELWANGPGQDPAPIYTLSRNASPKMPVWFVSTAELLPLLESGSVTIAQLRAMRSLRRGVAWRFEESLYPNLSAPSPGVTLRAEGRLETHNRILLGSRFTLDWHYHAERGEDEVTIRFDKPKPRLLPRNSAEQDVR